MLTDIKKILYIIFLTFFCLGCDSKYSTQDFKEKFGSMNKDSRSQKEVDLEHFVLNFYEIYFPYSLGQENENKLSDFLLKNGDDFLTNNLKLLILDDIKCAEEGYVCNLEMDPFYNSQDKIILSNVLKSGDRSVDVLFDNKSKVKILLDCKIECLISNVFYPDGSSLEQKLKQKF